MSFLRPLSQCSAECSRTAVARGFSSASASRLVRPIGSPDPSVLEGDFALYPGSFDLGESRELLSGASWKSDRVDPIRKRRRRNVLTPSDRPGPSQDVFHGEYGFQEGHYDSVIHDYRETTISSLPPSTSHPNLPRSLNRAFALLPGSPQIDQEVLPHSTITHLLHLAPSGRILGHVDNLEASGSVIMGVCSGADRILRSSRKTGARVEGWDVLLQNGTAYSQKDKSRYEYEHAILGYDESEWEGKPLEGGHRLSIMVRDAPRPRSM